VITILYLARSILEFGKDARRKSARYRKNIRGSKRTCNKNDCAEFNETLDLDTYPIGEGVVYEMIHQRHRHQRDDLRIKNKSENEKKKETERKHRNSRRLEVNINIIFYRYSLFIYEFL